MAAEAADVSAGMRVGKSMGGEDPVVGHLARNEEPKDTRALEDVVKRDPLPVDPNDLLAGLAELPNDPKEIERLLGVAYGDRTLESAGPPGSDQTVHRLRDAAEQGAADEPVIAASAASEAAAAPAASATPAASAATPAPAAQATSPAAGTSDAGAEGSVEGPIVSRDGKATIPYGVLAAERRRNAQLERELAELRGRASGAAAATPGDDPGNGAAAEGAAAAEGEQAGQDMAAMLARLRENYPEELVTVVEAAVTRAAAAEQRVSEMIEAGRERAADMVNDLIDRDPDLSKWRDDDANPELFDLASEIDDRLRADPRWADRTALERFETVKQMVSLQTGVALTPKTTPTADPAPTPAATTPAVLPQNLAAAAEARVAAAAQRNAGRPLTHSDLPAGTPPPQSEAEQVAGMNTVQLEKFLSGAKDFNQLSAMLAKLA